MRSGDYNRQVRVDHLTETGTDPATGNAILDWLPLYSQPIWASVQDSLPSRNESVALNLPVERELTRVRYPWRDGITPKMRMVLLGKGSKVMQIIGGPAEVQSSGRTREQEVMCETIF